jgi:hypothetical protein
MLDYVGFLLGLVAAWLVLSWIRACAFVYLSSLMTICMISLYYM